MKSQKTNLDSPQTTIEREKVIKRKYFLKNIYTEFYNMFKEYSHKAPPGKKLELGSGAGFIKEVIPKVITSDIMKLPNCDLVVNAEKMPFSDKSLSAIYMLNTFHHIKNPEKALHEFVRCLKKRGKIIMIEPYNSFWGRYIYKNFHHETFDPKSDWRIKGNRSLSDANGALPWIIFKRDRKEFEKKFSTLRIKQIVPHTPFMYLISGGFSSEQLLPNFMYIPMLVLERLISFLNPLLGMFATIEIERK